MPRARKIIVVSVGLLLGVCALPGAPVSAGSAAFADAVEAPAVPAPGGAAATLAQCHQGPLPAERFAVFDARMAALPRTAYMAVRFDLYSTSAAGRPPAASAASAVAIVAPGLGVWHRSANDVAIFDYQQTVASLLPAVTYRTVVSFRWYGRSGRVHRHARHETGACEPFIRAARPRG